VGAGGRLSAFDLNLGSNDVSNQTELKRFLGMN